MTAEQMLETYYSLKDTNDSMEAELDGKPAAVHSYDEMYERELLRREDIRLHGKDTEYARKLLEVELERGEKLSSRRHEAQCREADDRQRQYNEETALYRLRQENERRREEERQEEYERRIYEEECRRREEEDYRRRRQADEEYYAQLRERNR